jgi:Tfp pilus assembly pilus retraction ATPase PilT
MIRKGRDLYSMQLFDQHLLDLVHTGLISMETAIYAARTPRSSSARMRVE